MKVRKVILTGLILSGSLFANTLSDTTSLIGQMKNINSSERFALMNQIKTNILSLNQSDKVEALKQMREARNSAREAKLATYKATLTPEKLASFEAHLKQKKEARKAYKEKMANFRASLTDEQREEMRNIKGRKNTKGTTNKSFNKGGRTTRYGKRYGKGGKRITSKVHTTLSAGELGKFKK